MRPALLLLALGLLTTGCHNACQRMCVEMSEFAEECGYVVAEAEYDACLESNATDLVTPEQLDLCDANTDPDALRDWWTCEDLKENYQNAAR